MSIEAMDWATTQRAGGPEQKLVMWILGDWGACDADQSLDVKLFRKLASVAEITEDRLSEVLDELVAKNLLVRLSDRSVYLAMPTQH